MALWNAWQLEHLGRSETEAQRRFFFRFGVDMFTAQSRTDLLDAVRADLARERIIDKTVTGHPTT